MPTNRNRINLERSQQRINSQQIQSLAWSGTVYNPVPRCPHLWLKVRLALLTASSQCRVAESRCRLEGPCRRFPGRLSSGHSLTLYYCLARGNVTCDLYITLNDAHNTITSHCYTTQKNERSGIQYLYSQYSYLFNYFKFWYRAWFTWCTRSDSHVHPRCSHPLFYARFYGEPFLYC